MRVAITHPFCWPHVRRGTERYLDVLTRKLTERGLDVTLISTAPTASDTTTPDQGRQILHRMPRVPAPFDRRIKDVHAFLVPAWRSLAALDVDVVHSFFFSDALAADLLKRRRDFRTIVQIHGPPLPQWLRRFAPPERPTARRVFARADRLVVSSRFVQALLRDHYGAHAELLRCPIDLTPFEPNLSPRSSSSPVLLGVANFAQHTKGIRVLLSGFALLKETYPGARLRISGEVPDNLHSELLPALSPGVAQDVEVLGVGAIGDLPALFRAASAMVLPSMWDASPYVVFEAWACGTPVVVADHGGAPEYVTQDTGVTFDPQTTSNETHNAAGLAEAMAKAIAMAADPATPARCRALAEQHDFRHFIDQLIGFYEFGAGS